MKIINVTDSSMLLEEFFHSLEGCNYVILVYFIKFTAEGKKALTCSDIDHIIQEYYKPDKMDSPVAGIIHVVSLDFMKEKILDCLSNSVDQNGEVDIETDVKIIHSRVETFWNILEKNFNIGPNTSIYMHEPYMNSYFDFGVMWFFCFVLINQDGEGTLICAGAAD